MYVNLLHMKPKLSLRYPAARAEKDRMMETSFSHTGSTERTPLLSTSTGTNGGTVKKPGGEDGKCTHSFDWRKVIVLFSINNWTNEYLWAVCLAICDFRNMSKLFLFFKSTNNGSDTFYILLIQCRKHWTIMLTSLLVYCFREEAIRRAVVVEGDH